MHLIIIAFACQTSDLLGSLDTYGPSEVAENDLKDWDGYGTWYRNLLKYGYLWEAQKLLRILLQVLNPETVSRAFTHGVRVLDGSDAPLRELRECTKIRTESNLLACLSATTAWGRYHTKLRWIYSSKGAQIQATQYFEEARKLAATIVQDYPDDLNSRPYLEWMLGEEELAQVNESKASGYLFNSLHSIYNDLIVFANGPASIPLLSSKILEQNCTERNGTSTIPNGNTYGFLPLILKTAKGNFDYRIQAECLREFAVARRYEGDIEGSVQEVSRLTHLQQDTMVDIPGLLNTLNLQWALIKNPEEPTLEAREELYSKHIQFDRRFLSSSHAQTAEDPSQNITFDIPLLKWGHLRAQRALLLVLGQKLQSARIEIEASLMKNELPIHLYNISDIPTAFSYRPIFEDERDVGQVDLKEVKAIIRRLRTEIHRLKLQATQYEDISEYSDLDDSETGPTNDERFYIQSVYQDDV